MKNFTFDTSDGVIRAATLSKDVEFAGIDARLDGTTCVLENVRALSDHLRTDLLRELYGKLEDRLFDAGAGIVETYALREDIELFEALGFANVAVGSLTEPPRYKMAKNLIFKGCDFLTGADAEAVLIRQPFTANKPKKATLYYGCFGFSDFFINGRAVTEAVMTPPWSNYERRDLSGSAYPIADKMSLSAYYMECDVTDLLTDGANCIAAHVGAGWYGTKHPRTEDMPVWGKIKCAFKLVLSYENSGELVIRSDARTAETKESWIKATRTHAGEIHNTEEYDPEWNLPGRPCGFVPAAAAETPVTFWRKWDFDPDLITGTAEPRLIHELGDRRVYDLGAQHSGRAVVKFLSNTFDDVAVVRYSEEINDDFTLDYDSTGGTRRIQRDVFICSPEADKLELKPVFNWHAGRYIEVSGNAEVVSFEDIHTDLKQAAVFSSSSPELQWLADAYVRTELMNVHGCVPSDCPHRERLGYTGDGQLSCRAVMRFFDSRKMYLKWMRDIADCQDIFNGHVQHTAPFYGGGGGPGGWGGAVCIVPLAYYDVYGDDVLLCEYFDNMRRYIDYMVMRSENGLVVAEEKQGWCLGDWCEPSEPDILPEPFVNTYFLIRCIRDFLRACDITGRTEEKPLAQKRLAEAEAALKATYRGADGSFLGGKNGADAYALDIGLGGDDLLGFLKEKYERLGEFDTGIFGTDILIRVLCRHGMGDLARKLLTSHGKNSFYNMQRHGATTLWEYWNGAHSHCHPMFGA
ncbi:MAG: family 78 glycoside hydrolase catalytic domain, partial [Clostridia bacterium]|nr:family 78 glycoside hydrolase catalytic domain [Clostridia bacterium]